MIYKSKGSSVKQKETLFTTQTQMLHKLIVTLNNYAKSKTKITYKQYLHQAIARQMDYQKFDQLLASDFNRLNSTHHSQLHIMRFCLQSQYRKDQFLPYLNIRKQFYFLIKGLRQIQQIDTLKISHFYLLQIVIKIYPYIEPKAFIQQIIIPQKYLRSGNNFLGGRILQILFLTTLIPQIRLRLGWQWSIIIADHQLQKFIKYQEYFLDKKFITNKRMNRIKIQQNNAHQTLKKQKIKNGFNSIESQTKRIMNIVDLSQKQQLKQEFDSILSQLQKSRAKVQQSINQQRNLGSSGRLAQQYLRQFLL